MNYKRKKRLIEIYFILYLALLLFVLPDSRNANKQEYDTGIRIYQPSFVLLPEKNTLICRVATDTTGPKIISLDSINTIFYTGDVEDVSFEFIVEDQSVNNSIKLTSDKKPTSKFFKFQENGRKHAAVFKWHPPLHELTSKTYLVKVIARAKKRNPDENINSEIAGESGKKEVKAITQFSLLLIYLNEPGGNPLFAQNFYRPMFEDTSYQFTLPFQNIIPQIPNGKINMIPKLQEIKQIPGQRWINFIIATNVNLLKDLTNEGIRVKYSPKNTTGNAEINDIREDEIVLQGITPTSGKMKVEVSITRKYDGEEKQVTFNVSPQPFEMPEYNKYMYPDMVYEIDPKLPEIGKRVYAVIRDENNRIRARSQKGEKFYFTPSTMDINKVFYLERYIDNELFGEKHSIRVLPYPNPVIVDIQRISDNEVEVITRAFGKNNKSRNEVDKFIITGNAKYKDLRGKITVKPEKSFTVTIQYFKFTPKNPSKPFNFKIIAVDKTGKKSSLKIFR